jgi:hypothetical protein
MPAGFAFVRSSDGGAPSTEIDVVGLLPVQLSRSRLTTVCSRRTEVSKHPQDYAGMFIDTNSRVRRAILEAKIKNGRHGRCEYQISDSIMNFRVLNNDKEKAFGGLKERCLERSMCQSFHRSENVVLT